MKKTKWLVCAIAFILSLSMCLGACINVPDVPEKGDDPDKTGQGEGSETESGGSESTEGGGSSGESSSDQGSESSEGGSGSTEGSGSSGSGTTTSDQYTVTFYIDGAVVSSSTVASGDVVTKYTPDAKDGYYLSAWYKNSSYATAYDFTTPVTGALSLYAKWIANPTGVSYVSGGYESIAVEWDASSVDSATVTYKLDADTTYSSQIDSNLIYMVDSGTARADILGLIGGQTYSVQIYTGSTTLKITDISVSSYDRSGYAHFNYTSGVGAYNDDGSLKDGALVIYVTENNKNDVTNYVYKYSASTGYTKEDISEYLTLSSDSQETYGKTSVTGIGEILNNRRYSGSDRMDVGIAKLCSVYGAVAVRIVGEVTAYINEDKTTYDLKGLTDFDALTNGGSEGDNGSMARMVNAHNLTIEGVGEDACVNGWGFHFISSATGAVAGTTGVGFEVRNITFKNYCEDATGMEGEQASVSTDSELTASVERCWVHNNTFYPGSCDFAAESDKKEGDGSCDFKRGQYFTLSYNYFEGCHKTNLIGSSKTSLQFNITMHHNYWVNCKSRIPLVRNANVHFYNNYVFGDITTGADLSYVHSARANSYIFAENNYYEGCKQVSNTSNEGGGAIKSYNNMYYACYNGDDSTQVTSRTETVANNCKFSARNIDYSTFDTNSTLFYYDSTNQKSDCYLTDAVTARKEDMQLCGVQKRAGTVVDTNMAMYADQVTSAVSPGDDGLVLDTEKLKTVTSAGVYDNIYFNNKFSSTGVKGKQQVATFKLAEETDVTIKISDTGKEVNLGELVAADGTVYASKFTSVTATLPAGTYFIASGSKDKEVTITYMSFVSGLTDEEKIANVENLINAIPSTIALDADTKSAIDLARSAYNALNATLQNSVTNYETLTSAESSYTTLVVNNVIDLITKIGYDSTKTNGNISSSSITAINAAREAYSALTSAQQALVTNYSDLVAAEAAYDSIAVEALVEYINSLPAVSSLTTQSALEEALESYQLAEAQYLGLDEDQLTEFATKAASGKGYDYVVQGIVDIQQALKIYTFKELLDDFDTTNLESLKISDMSPIINAYNALTTEQQSTLTDTEKTKYESIASAYNDLMEATIVLIFGDPSTNSGDNIAANTDGVTITGSYKSGESFKYGEEEYSSPLKSESSTKITVTVASGVNLKITVCFSDGGHSLKVSSGSWSLTNPDSSGSDGMVTYEISAENNTGTIEFEKNSGTKYIYYMIIEVES